ncbi:MAG: hypothetical protein FJ304_21555 [Planctomycetes bacterium]|nr:hypothetical protein [Planctomycetota bacterium]
MSHTVSTPTFEVHLPEPPVPKFERERRAFFRLLPELLGTHRGQYVAVHDERVIDTGPDQIALALRVRQRLGNVPLYVHLVTDEPDPVYRSGVVRGGGTREAQR